MTTSADIALLLRIKYSFGLDLQKLLTEFSNKDLTSQEVIDALEEKLMSCNEYLATSYLTSVIVKFKLHNLLRSRRDQIIRDARSLARIFVAGLGDDQVEEILCDKLYGIYKDNTSLLRRSIVEAMRAHGTPRCLPTLEAIQYDLDPMLKTKSLVSKAIQSSEAPDFQDYAYSVDTGSLQDFMQAVKEALAAIGNRPPGTKA